MIPFQEIDIYSDNKAIIKAHVVVTSQMTASAEISIYDASQSNQCSPYQTIGQYSTAADAFEAIITASEKYFSRSGDVINRINNPCNTEFLDKAEQQKIVDFKYINVQVEVNA
ncbi:hypothetical protein [Aeromonas salmonicida]|uniref:hypothetical protein n=1 Tax=Aeromonas salmonicida TaxID=645 RepID=UPI0030CD162E